MGNPPNIPEFPINPQGPSEQQPNTQLSDAIQRLSTVAENQASAAKALEDALKHIPSVASEVSKGFHGMGLELEANLETVTSIDEGLKSISSTARSFKKGVFSTRNFKQAQEAINHIVAGQEKIKKLAGAGTKEYAQAVRIQEKLAHWIEKNKAAINATGDAIRHMNDEELKEFSKMIHDTVGDADKLVRTFRAMSVNHVTRQLHSMSKTLAELGIGRGFSQKMDKYMAGAEIKARVADYRKSRVEGNIAAAQTKRDAIIQEIKSNPGRFGVNLNEAGELDMGDKGVRGLIGKRMGLGKKALGMFVEGNEEAALAGGAGLGSRLLSGAAGATEGLVGGAAGMMAEAAPVLAVLEVLKETFDKVVEQNKHIESGLGKAGLFAQPGTTGYMEARRNLTPEDAYTRLGMSFDRNLKLAQALQEGGMGLRELVTGEGKRAAGEGFGPGGFGQFQRIVMGAGRMAGFTDAEGVQQTLKLLNEYRATMEDSEDFFIKVRKGADAAGLSTTKYIAIIDEINSHFNRMNKNLNESLNVLTELGRTGRLGSEDLKQYMDFLTAGGPAKGMQDVAMNAFTLMNMSPTLRASREAGAQYNVDEAVKAANQAGFQITAKDLMGPNAQAAIQQLDYQLANDKTMSPDQQKAAQAALDRLRDAASRYQGVAGGGDAIGQAFGQTFAMSPDELAAMNQAKLQTAVERAGGSMAEFMNNPQLFGAQHKAFAGILQMEGLSPELAMKAFHGRGQAATTMLTEAAGVNQMPEGQRKRLVTENAKLFLREWKRSKALQGIELPVKFDEKDIDQMSPENLEGLFKANNKEFSKYAAGMNAVSDFVQKGYLMGEDVTGEREDTLRKARIAGAQTQTTGEMIANAFSKWFNNIIGFLGKITDHLLGTSDAEKAEAAKAYNRPDNVERRKRAEDITSKKMNEALSGMQTALEKGDADAYDKAQQTYEEQRDILNKIQDYQGDKTKSDEQKWEAVINKQLGATTGTTAAGAAIRANLSPQQIASQLKNLGYIPSDAMSDQTKQGRRMELAGQTYGALSMMPGVKEDVKTGIGTIDSKSFDKMSDALQTLVAAGAITLSQPDQQGNRTIQINNYSAEFTQSSQAQAANRTGDSQPKTPQPVNKPKDH